MTGKAYTPKGWEPEAFGRFDAPAPEVMEAQRARKAKELPINVDYKEAMEYRKRGEAHILGHYVYEMMFCIYAGIEDRLMEGAIDTHLHIWPDYVPRCIDVIELAIDASKAKMRAIVLKDHFFTNVGQCWAAQWVVEDLVRRGELEQSCQVLGTHIFAWSHHPDQVNLVRKYPNLGAIFFRTMTGGGRFAGDELPVVDDKGKILPRVKECIHACAEYKIPIMTGHVGLGHPGMGGSNERMVLVEAAHEYGCRILVTHAGGATLQLGSMDEAIELGKEMAKLGAFLEVNGNSFLPNMMHPCCDPNCAMDYMRAVGPENCVANTDFGQVMCEHPVEGFRLFIRGMLHFGFSESEIKTMVQTNPAKLLYLDE